MIHDVANPLNYTIDTKYRVGIDLPKSIYVCKSCNKEYEPWFKDGNKNVFMHKCDQCMEH